MDALAILRKREQEATRSLVETRATILMNRNQEDALANQVQAYRDAIMALETAAQAEAKAKKEGEDGLPIQQDQ
ncbi:MAG: hypothetical protein PHQ43_04505 [Dehalococcoidales bacterium]|nr:hypothetical protein [Dehalococcoidales bacterium]